MRFNCFGIAAFRTTGLRPGKLAGLALAGLALLGAASGWACSVPVFRYALERWPPDAYVAFVFHRGELTQAQQALVRDLGEEGLAGQSFANLYTRTVDLEKEEEGPWTKVWEANKSDQTPWVVVAYPPGPPIAPAFWSGPLTEQNVKALVSSPLRSEIVRRLVAGDSAVWIFLEVGNKEKDDAAAKLLEQRLQHLNKTLDLPSLASEDIASGLVSVPEDALKVAFSMVRLSRQNPAEQMLVKMLMGTEEDLGELAEPMAFPIFGRGRALYALVGAGINADIIDEACVFLTGACSCQVKELNPGLDLLLAADWESLILNRLENDQELPPLAGLSGFGAPAPVSEPARQMDTNRQPEPAAETTAAAAAPTNAPVNEAKPDAEPTPPSGGSVQPVLWSTTVVVVLGVLVVGVLTVVLLKRKGD